MSATDTMLVIGYDGSPGADRAVGAAALLFPSASAVIVTVDEPVLETVAGAELAASGAWMNPALADRAALTAASRTAAAGVERADASGLHATARPAVSAPVWVEISRVASEVNANAIVVGSRGHGALVGGLLGSVSAALARHACRPVLVVPRAQGEPDSNSAHPGIAHAP